MKDSLYRYYESETGPFRKLSNLSLEEANQVLGELKQRGEVFASRRPENYMVIRRQLEAKARDMFIEKGGRPKTDFPHYMTLGPCDWLKSWYKQGKVLRVPLEYFDESVVSFTYGDLFPTMRVQDGGSMTVEQWHRHFEVYGICVKDDRSAGRIAGAE